MQPILGVTGKDVARRHVTRRGLNRTLAFHPRAESDVFSNEKAWRPMTKVTTSLGGQVEHQAQMCARVKKGADNPVISSVAPVQVSEGKQQCPDGTLHL